MKSTINSVLVAASIALPSLSFADPSGRIQTLRIGNVEAKVGQICYLLF